MSGSVTVTGGKISAVLLVLAAACLFSTGGTASGSEQRALILVDDLPGGSASTSQEVLENLLGHFGLPFDVKLLDEYAAGDIENHSVTFYLGSTWDRMLPPTFMEDVMTTDRRVVWINHNIWRLEWSQYEQAFQDKYGFTFIQTRSTAGHERVSFRGRSFTRLQNDFGQTLILDPGKAEALALVTDGSTSFPYVIHSGNFFYVADDPMAWITEDSDYIVFAELMHDMVGIDHPESHRAMVRIEDVDPTEDPARVRAIADYLESEGVPFSLAVIPRFEDPLGAWGAPRSIGMSERPELVSALNYAVAKGGTIILHGYTHQYGSTANPWNGVTGVDSEFYIQGRDGAGNVVSVGPVPEDSVPWAEGRIDAGLAELEVAGLPRPLVWETPHYLASDLDNQVFAARFGVVYQRFADAYFPYVIEQSVYGSRVLPENMGFVDATLAPPQVMIGRAERNLAVRDGFASFFFHSEKDINLLKQTVSGLKSQGYTFVSVDSLGSSGPFLFSESFTDGDAAGWQTQEWGDPSDWRVWSLGGKQVYAGLVQDFGWSLNGPGAPGDHVIEADMAFSRDTTTAGLAFRASGDIDSGSYYYFGLYPGEDMWKLYAVNKGNWGNVDQPLAQGSLALASGTLYRLKVSSRGSSIDLFIDGQPLAGGSLSNSDHPAGSFGPWLAQGAAYYDDILVTENGYGLADDFNDGDAAGWELAPASAWILVGSDGQGALRASSAGDIATAWAGPEALRDQVVAADVAPADGTATAGLAFRGDGRTDGSYYYFGLYPGEGKWRLYSVIDGDWGDPGMPLAQGAVTVTPGAVYRLQAAAIGDTVSLSIDGQPLAGGSLTLTDHRAGRFGPWMALGEADFDNIMVTQG